MSTQLQILGADLQPLTAPPSFAGVPGARSNVETLHVVNGDGGDTATELALRVMERAVGETVWLASGRPLVDGRRVEVRIVGGVGDLDVEPGPWQPVGSGRELALPVLAGGEGVALEVSLVLPFDAQAAQVELYLAVRSTAVMALGAGLSETVGDGVQLGLGDGNVTHLVEGGRVTPSDPADNAVHLEPSGWIAAGVPQAVGAEDFVLDATDGDGVPLAAGSAYWAAVHLTEDGSVAVERSPQGPQPLDVALQPAIPAGSVAVATVLRDDSGAIDASSIDPLSVPVASLTFDGLTGTLGPSAGLVDNRWWRRDVAESVTVSPSSTSWLWRLPTGDVAVSDGSRPEPRALPLFEVEADPFGVVQVERRYPVLGRPEVVRFVFGGPLTVGQVVYASWPHPWPGYLLPRRGEVVAQVVDGPGTSGATGWDVEVAAPGSPAVWASLFDVERPIVPWDSTTRTDATALPQVVTVPPHALLRCTVVEETAASQPSGGVVSLTLHR